MALEIAQTNPAQVLYIDDRAMFVEVAKELGIRGLHHQSFESTRKILESIKF
jgi:putative hydrolase of the HAD superfamily